MRQLNSDEQARLEAERDLIRDVQNVIKPSDFIAKSTRDLPFLQSCLESGFWIESPDFALSAIATSFGDVLTTEPGMHWVVVMNEEDTNIALRYKDSDISIHPRDMIIKRVLNDEMPDLYYLLEYLEEFISEMANDPRVYGNLGS